MSKFTSLFIKEDKQVQPSNDVQNEVTAAPKRNFVQQPVTQCIEDGTPVQKSVDVPSTVATSGSISVDEKIVNMIWDKIIAANRPGPDYLELKNNVDALDDLPISNEQKLISAFKVLKKTYPNFQKDDIIKAIDFYLNVVNDEKNEGLKQLEEMRINNVDGAETEIKAIQAKAEELKRQYNELQSNIDTKTLELTQAKNKIEINHRKFIGSVDAVVNVLTRDKDNILTINF